MCDEDIRTRICRQYVIDSKMISDVRLSFKYQLFRAVVMAQS